MWLTYDSLDSFNVQNECFYCLKRHACALGRYETDTLLSYSFQIIVLALVDSHQFIFVNAQGGREGEREGGREGGSVCVCVCVCVCV